MSEPVRPTTREGLVRDLGRLGVVPGGCLIVHSSYRALKPVEGGPAAVVAALAEAVGPEGTVLAPTFTTDLIDPATWPVPPSEEERRAILEGMAEFDPATSAPHKMGAVATALWKAEGALRSRHPVTSWTALGPLAEALLRDQPLDDPEGADGPVGRVHRRGGQVLLLGVEQDANTTIHLAESLLDMPHLRVLPDRYPGRDAEGRRVFLPVAKTTKCSDGFVKIQPHLEAAGLVRHGRVGRAPAQLLGSRQLVAAAMELLARAPTALLCDDPECVHCPTSARVLEGFRAEGR